MTLFEFAAIFVSAGVLFVGWYCNHRTERLRKYKECADHFFKKAKTIMSDQDTPADALMMIDFMNSHITSKNSAKDFFLLFAFYRNNTDEVEKLKRRANFAELDRFFESRPELQAAFGEAMAAGLLAISYNSGPFGLWGFLARHGILSPIRSNNSIAPGVVQAYRSGEMNQTNHNQTLHAA